MNRLLDSPIPPNHLLRTLIPACLVSACRLPPGRYRIAPARRLAFSATMRMVNRIHRHAAYVRSDTAPAGAAGFAQRDIFVLDIPNLSDCGPAFNRHSPYFARRHAQLRVSTLLGQQLSEGSGSARHLPAFAGTHFNIVNLRTQRDVANRQSISGKNVRVLSAGDRLSHFQAGRSDNITLLAVDI